MQLVSPRECNAAGIFDSIKEIFNNAELELTRCVMFTSDGAEVMLGRHNGVQALMKVN